ncbi:MAG: phosphatase PAP2 family protein [Candidatus Zixiibacteriota bacterium]
MIDFLGNLDQILFSFINSSMANPVTDFLMPIITSDDLLRIAYGVAMLALLVRGNRRLRWLVLFSALTLLLTDQLSAHLLKPLIARIRPCHTIADIHLLVGCGSGYSMPSAHAANAFGQAALFGIANKRTLKYLLSVAALISLSRIFVGVHYPFDIVAGAAIGVFVGVITYCLFCQVDKKWRICGIRNSHHTR